MKKILIINTVLFNMGGISSVIINYLKNMNKNNMDITIIVNSQIENSYKEFFEKNEIKIIILERKKNIIKYMYELNKIMKINKFDVVHIHGNSSTMAFESVPAHLNKIKKIIVHAHNISCNYKILNKILKPIFKSTYTLAISCSNNAGKWLFGKNEKFLVLNNAIDLKRYEFNIDAREDIRKELNLNNKYIIGHVGYFNEQKNHEKLFQIVNYLKDKINIKLLCVSGNNEIPDNIKDMIIKYNLEENIIILLRRNDVNKLLQAMDLFVFPSKYEGLGLALIEAQATGLNCFVSDRIPIEAIPCSNLVKSIDLSTDIDKWGDFILSIVEKDKIKYRKNESTEALNKLKEVGYDISLEANKLREIYMN